MLKNHEELIEKLKAVYGDNGFYYVLENWYKDYLVECKKPFSLCHYEELSRLYGCINGAIWGLYGANLISNEERETLIDELSIIGRCNRTLEGGVVYGESLN